MSFLRMVIVEGRSHNIYVFGQQIFIFLSVIIEFLLYKTCNFVKHHIFKQLNKIYKRHLQIYFIQFTRFLRHRVSLNRVVLYVLRCEH